MSEEIHPNDTLLPMINKIDPVEFDVTISALLIGLGAEKYIDIFRRKNIGQCTLTELTDEDLIKLGLDNADIRKKLLEDVKNLPVYEENSARSPGNLFVDLTSVRLATALKYDDLVLTGYTDYFNYTANSQRLPKHFMLRPHLVTKENTFEIYVAITTNSKYEKLGPMEIADVLEESSQHLYRIYLSMLANTLAIKKTKKITDSLLYQDKYASNLALATLSEIHNILNSMEIALHTQMKDFTKDSKNIQKKIIVGSVGGAVIILLATLFARSLKSLK